MSDKDKDTKAPRKITLQRKTHTELKVETTPGQARTVPVEVRKRRTYIKRKPEAMDDIPTVDNVQMAEETVSHETSVSDLHSNPVTHADEKVTGISNNVDNEDSHLKAAELRKTEEAKAQQERIGQAREKAEAEAREKIEAEKLRKGTEARKKQEEIQRIADAGRSASENTVSKVAIQFQSDEPVEDIKEEIVAVIATPTHKKEEKAQDKPSTESKAKPKKSRPVKEESEHRAAPRRKPRREMANDEREEISIKLGSRRRKKQPKQEHGFQLPTETKQIIVELSETITVADLAHKMSVKVAEVIKTLMKMGSMVTINQVLDRDTAALVVEEMRHKYKFVSENILEDELLASIESDDSISLVERPPVVTIMGHVDHGKTSLLDYIRNAHVVKGEAGGITQHIGAYHVKTKKGVISFLDTPGHSAFAAMRARGAKVTDIVVLVVAADDGVMPQTIEGIQHAKASNIPVIVAVTKVDKPTADTDRIRSELSQRGIISEEWGGENLFAYVSSKTGEGIDHLLDQILVQAEILELKAINEGPARGTVIESRLDRGRGTVASVLVQSGLLQKGDIVLAGFEYGRVRALIDETGNQVDNASPSIPVEILGLSGVPNAGDEVMVVPNERKAREIANFRQGKFREIKLARQHKSKLENLFSDMADGEKKILNIVLKADVQGSVEALIGSLTELSNDEITVNVIASGVGGINESDANLAVSSDALVIGFNVRADNAARKILEEEAVTLHYYSVIYDVIDEVKKALIGKLDPEFKEEIIGIAQVRDVFRSPKIGAIAGCMVIEGTVKRNNPIRVLRDNIVIYEGELESLRRFKDDVSEVRMGTECGIGVKNYNDVREGDQIEVYEKIQVERKL